MNEWKDYPTYRRNQRRKPLIDTGNNEGWEDARDAGKFIGEKIADGAKAVGRGIKNLFRKEDGK